LGRVGKESTAAEDADEDLEYVAEPKLDEDAAESVAP
jgi:hypothetical protein